MCAYLLHRQIRPPFFARKSHCLCFAWSWFSEVRQAPAGHCGPHAELREAHKLALAVPGVGGWEAGSVATCSPLFWFTKCATIRLGAAFLPAWTHMAWLDPESPAIGFSWDLECDTSCCLSSAAF